MSDYVFVEARLKLLGGWECREDGKCEKCVEGA